MTDCPVELSRIGVEVWRDIPGHADYQASNLGRVRSLDRFSEYAWRGKTQRRLIKGRVLKPVHHKAGGGHMNVTVGPTPRLVHHLVMQAFIGPRPEGLDTRHLDDIGSNNALHNLCYGTRSENGRDAYRNGVCSKGENARNRKLTEAQVVEIKQLLKDDTWGIGERLAAQFGVTSGAIAGIKSGKNWGHVSC